MRMTKQIQRWGITLGMIVSALGLSVGIAQAAVIFPVTINSTSGLPMVVSNSPVTVSVFQDGTGAACTPGASGCLDVTATWLPEPGKSVNIVVNGLASFTISLVTPTSFTFDGTTNPFLKPNTLTTSAYLGTCTNFTSALNVEPDFTLGFDQLTKVNRLTANDCGGMAVIQVKDSATGFVYTFILPQDSNANGMPDIWENQFGGNLTANADIDTGPGTAPGDGIANFDEYRGFMISGGHVRTDPRQKDLFVHLVNPQCLPVGTTPQQFLTSTASLLGGGPVTYPTDNSPLFANLTPLISNTQVHFLGYAPLRQNYTTTEWIDHFVSFTVSGGFVYDTPNPPDDRQINKNALYPVTDVLTGLKIQKGVRITECIDASSTSPVGSAGWGTPNGPDNALIYTQRIVNYVNSLIGSSTQLTFSTFVNGAWSTPSTTNANALITKTIEFYLGMEIGHAVELTPTVEGIRTTSYGYHHAPGTGSNMDQTVTNKLSTKSGSGNTFYIPSLYNSGDQSNFKLND